MIISRVGSGCFGRWCAVQPCASWVFVFDACKPNPDTLICFTTVFVSKAHCCCYVFPNPNEKTVSLIKRKSWLEILYNKLRQEKPLIFLSLTYLHIPFSSRNSCPNSSWSKLEVEFVAAVIGINIHWNKQWFIYLQAMVSLQEITLKILKIIVTIKELRIIWPPSHYLKNIQDWAIFASIFVAK